MCGRGKNRTRTKEMTTLVVEGSIDKLARGVTKEGTPIHVQIINPKPTENFSWPEPGAMPHGAKVYKMSVSDGDLYMPAIVHPKFSYLFEDGTLVSYNLVKVVDYCLRTYQDMPIMMIRSLDVRNIEAEKGKHVDRIGNPKKCTDFKTGLPSLRDAAMQQAPGGFMSSTTMTSASNNVKQPSSAQKRVATEKAPGSSPVKKSANDNTAKRDISVSALSPYGEGWLLRVRCTQKGPIREYNNAKGPGRLFSVTFADGTGEIRGTVFSEQVDRLHNLIQPGQTYSISNAMIKLANAKFNTTNHEYELVFSEKTKIESIPETSDIPLAHYNFVPISELQNRPLDSPPLDVVGVVRSIEPVQTIQRKNRTDTINKRDIVLVDDTECAIKLTLWAERADDFDESLAPPVILAVKSVKLNEFRGRNLTTTMDSSFQYNDMSIPKVRELRTWWMEGGKSSTFHDISGSNNAEGARAPINYTQVTLRDLQTADEGNYQFTAKIIRIKDGPVTYKACPNCRKKVSDGSGPGEWECEKCGPVSSVNHNYLFTLQVGQDGAPTIFVTCYSEAGNALFGMTAEEILALQEEDPTEYSNKLSEVTTHEFIFKTRLKHDTYQNETRQKINVNAIETPNYSEMQNTELNDLEREIGSESERFGDDY